MAVHLATSADYLKRTTALLPASGDSTVCFWVRFNAISTAPAYQTSYIILDDPGVYTNYAGMFTNSAGNTLDVSGSIVHATVPTAGQWYFYAWVQVGTAQRFLINANQISAVTKNRAAWTNGFEFLGNDTFSDGNIDIAYCREWTAALTGPGIQREMWTATADRTANLYMDCPLTSDLLDISGNGHDWTQVGSGSFVAGPAVFTNTSAATAIALPTSLPVSYPVAIPENFWNASSGGNISLYYTYDPPADTQIVSGFWFSAPVAGQYQPSVNASTIALGNVIGGARNVPLQLPTATNQQWSFAVTNNGTSTTSAATLTISILPGPSSAVPVGAIFVNDDTTGFKTGLVSATDGANYQVLRFFDVAVTTSETGGDVLENGRLLIASDDDSTYRLYDGQLELVTTVSGLIETLATSVRTCVGAQVFYVGKPGNGLTAATIHRVDGNGLLTQSWTLPSAGLTGLSASNDESIIYVTGQLSSINAPIKQWDPNTSTFGANLVGGVANYASIDMLVLGDDSIIGLYGRTGGAPATILFARRYDAAGAILNTYTLNPATTGNTEASLFHAIDDPNSFWARVHDVVANGTCTFYNIKASDGSILSTVTQATYEGGGYDPPASDTPLSRFGLSLSCPSFILREAINPPIPVGEPVEYLIRRERWWPHISSEQKRQFFSKLQVDLQAGNGVTAGPVTDPVQGEDPILEVDWSDDGGWRWSTLRFVKTGKIGAYRHRAMSWRMGHGRDRVYRIACSDPNQWVIINGYLDAELGTS